MQLLCIAAAVCANQFITGIYDTKIEHKPHAGGKNTYQQYLLILCPSSSVARSTYGGERNKKICY